MEDNCFKKFTSQNVNQILTERLRSALDQEKILEPDDFGCLIQAIYYDNGTLAKGFILYPFIINFNKDDVFSVLIDGYMYSFYLYNKNIIEEKQFFLQKNGTMQIIGRFLLDDLNLFEKIRIGFDYLHKQFITSNLK